MNLDELITGITPYELTFSFEDLGFFLAGSVFKEKHSDALLQLAARHLVLWGPKLITYWRQCVVQSSQIVRPLGSNCKCIQNAFEEQKSCSVKLVQAVSKSHFKAALKRPDVSRTELELLEKERWASALVSFIQEANLPLKLPSLLRVLHKFFFLLSKLWSRHVKPSSAIVEETYEAKQKILKFVQAEAFPESESCTSQRIAVQACKTELRNTEKHGATQKPTRSPHCKIQSIMNSE